MKQKRLCTLLLLKWRRVNDMLINEITNYGAVPGTNKPPKQNITTRTTTGPRISREKNISTKNTSKHGGTTDLIILLVNILQNFSKIIHLVLLQLK